MSADHRRFVPIFIWLLGFAVLAPLYSVGAREPVKIIFDTDVGNDIDDALALSVIHALISRGEAELLAVTVCKDNPWGAVYINLVNTFYGRGAIPVGSVRGGKTPEDGKFIRAVAERKVDAKCVYARTLEPGQAADATELLRGTLAGQADHSVVIVSVGFMTNLARLLNSKADAISPLNGVELVKQKVKMYVQMAGAFNAEGKPEYNVHIDAEASRVVYERWPTPIVASGYEIGEAIRYPATSIERDFAYVENHPVTEAYRLYDKMPYDRQCWDLTAVLYAIRREHDYFGLSEPGTISLGEKSVTNFRPSAQGRHRYFKASPEQIVRVREALTLLASQPPQQLPKP